MPSECEPTKYSGLKSALLFLMIKNPTIASSMKLHIYSSPDSKYVEESKAN